MTEKNEKSSIIKYIFLFILLAITPAVAVKLAKYTSKDTKKVDQIDAKKVEKIVENYLSRHPDELLNSVMNSYYARHANPEHDERINNGILFFEKILFDEKIPKILSTVKDPINLAVFFSDSILIVPILEEIISFSNSQKLNFFFHQLVTQNKFSGIIAKYAYAVYQSDPKSYPQFYLSVLKIPKKELDQDKIYAVIKSLNLDLDKVISLADSQDSESTVLNLNNMISQLQIDQLPAFVFENRRIVFGDYGFEAVKKLMY